MQQDLQEYSCRNQQEKVVAMARRDESFWSAICLITGTIEAALGVAEFKAVWSTRVINLQFKHNEAHMLSDLLVWLGIGFFAMITMRYLRSNADVDKG
jgi:hypothetical protein